MPEEIEEPESRLSLLIAPGALLLGFVLALFGTLFVEIVGRAFGSSVTKPTPAVNLISNLVFDLGFVAAALYFVVLRNGFGMAARPESQRMGARAFGYVRISPWIGLLAVLVGGGIYLAISNLYASALNLHGSDKLPSDFGVMRSHAAAVGATLLVGVVAPVCEEFFFRGFLFGVLARMRVRVRGADLGPWIAALIVGIIFGLAHTGSALAEDLVPLGMFGFILCLIRWWTGSLYPTMTLHSINNSLAIGVVEFHLGIGWIVLIAAGCLTLVALITWPLSRSRAPRSAVTAP